MKELTIQDTEQVSGGITPAAIGAALMMPVTGPVFFAVIGVAMLGGAIYGYYRLR